MYTPKTVPPMQPISRITTCPQTQCTVVSLGCDNVCQGKSGRGSDQGETSMFSRSLDIQLFYLAISHHLRLFNINNIWNILEPWPRSGGLGDSGKPRTGRPRFAARLHHVIN